MLLIINPEYVASIYSLETALPLFLLSYYLLHFHPYYVLTNIRFILKKIPTVFCHLEEEQAPWTEGKNV